MAQKLRQKPNSAPLMMNMGTLHPRPPLAKVSTWQLLEKASEQLHHHFARDCGSLASKA
jgi:hypothetical protein